MPYDVKNFLKMANMFGQERDLNPTLIPPEISQHIMPGESGGMPTGAPPPIPSMGLNTGSMAPAAQAPPMEAPQAPAAPPAGQDMPDFVPQMRASNRAYEMLDQMPKPNVPGVGRKIGASLVTLGLGPQYGERALYGPYNTQMEQWKQEFEPTVQAANQERYYNANMRALAEAHLRDKTAQDRIDVAQQRADTYAQSVEGRNKVNEAKLEIEKWKLANPEGSVQVLRDGKIALVNKRTGESIDTGLTSRDVNPIELENLRASHAMERVGATGENQRELERLRQERLGPPIQIFTGGQPTTPYQFDQRGNAKPVEGLPPGSYLRDTPPGTSSSSGDIPLETPAQELQRRRANADRVLKEHPEWAAWIDFDPSDPSSMPEISPPGSTTGGMLGFGEKSTLSQEGYDHLVKEILHGRTQLPSRVPKGGVKAAPAPSTPTSSTPKVGDTKVAPNGLKLRFDGKGWVKAE